MEVPEVQPAKAHGPNDEGIIVPDESVPKGGKKGEGGDGEDDDREPEARPAAGFRQGRSPDQCGVVLEPGRSAARRGALPSASMT